VRHDVTNVKTFTEINKCRKNAFNSRLICRINVISINLSLYSTSCWNNLIKYVSICYTSSKILKCERDLRTNHYRASDMNMTFYTTIKINIFLRLISNKKISSVHMHRKREIYDLKFITHDVDLLSVINLFNSLTRILILIACTTQFFWAIFDSLDNERDFFNLTSRHARS
jgi:hypothetical protein